MNPKFARIIIQEMLKDPDVFNFLHKEFAQYLWNNPRLRGPSLDGLDINWKNHSRLQLHSTVACDGEALFNTASGNIKVG